MSLDNANPTVFRKPVAGGGRKRFKFDDSPLPGEGEFDLDNTDFDKIFHKIFHPEKYRDLPKSDVDKKQVYTPADFIDAQEIYGKILFLFFESFIHARHQCKCIHL